MSTLSLKKEENTMEELQDIIIICKDCGKEFVWTVGEQEFYREKGFTNPPVRCKECRDQRKAERNNNRDYQTNY